MNPKSTELIKQSVEGVTHIIMCGSRARNNHFVDSDIDLLLVGNFKFFEKISETSSIAMEISSLEGIPKVDICKLTREHLECPSINPKYTTLQLEFKQLWKRDEESDIKACREMDPSLLCSFLEYERLRNIEIFKNKELSTEYIKKMPGGRRSYDEMFWLNKLAKGDTNVYDKEMANHQNLVRSCVTDFTTSKAMSKMAPKLDKKIFDIECSFIPKLRESEIRGDAVLYNLFPKLYRAYSSSNPDELDALYSDNKDLKNPSSWIAQYAIAFNRFIGTETAHRIASTNRKECFDYEIKKSIIQNRAANEPRFKNILEILSKDDHPLVSLYANIKLDPKYIETLPENYRNFVKHTISHIL